jgi:MFS family permease
MGQLIAVLATTWRTDVTTVTAGIAAYSLGNGCALPLWGAAADRHGARRVLRTGLLCAAVASAASAVCPGPAGWVGLRLAAGACFACVTPCVSLFCEATPSARERHRALAGITAAAAAAAVATPLLAMLVVRVGSWRQAFVLLALLVAGTAGLLRVDRPAPRPVPAPGRPLSPAGPPGPAGAPASAAYWTVVGVGAAEGVALLTLPALLAPSLALSGAPTVTALVAALNPVGVCGSTVLLQGPCRHWHPTALLALGGVLGVAGAGLAAVSPGAFALCSVAVLLGLSWGCLHTTLQTWLPRLLPPRARARAASLFAASAMLTSSLTIPLSTSMLLDGARAAVFTTGAAACAGLTCLAMALARRWT